MINNREEKKDGMVAVIGDATDAALGANGR